MWIPLVNYASPFLVKSRKHLAAVVESNVVSRRLFLERNKIARQYKCFDFCLIELRALKISGRIDEFKIRFLVGIATN